MNNTQIKFIETSEGFETIGGLGCTLLPKSNGRWAVWRGTHEFTATSLEGAKQLAINLSFKENWID